MDAMDTDITTVPTSDLQEQIRLADEDIQDLLTRPRRMAVEEIELNHLRRWHAQAAEELSRRERELARREQELAESRRREEIMKAQEWFYSEVEKSQGIIWARAAGSGPTDKDYSLVNLAKDYAENRIQSIPFLALYRQYTT